MNSLEVMASIIRKVGRFGSDFSPEAFADHLGHSTTNSGAFKQKLASLREWGLIKSRGDRIELTDTAIALVFPETDAAESGAMLEAFHNSTVFSHMLDVLAVGQPIDPDRVGAQAVRQLGVAPRSSEKFGQSFAASAIAAGLAEPGDGNRIVLRPSPQAQAASTPSADQASPSTADVPTSAAQPKRPSAAPMVIRQSWQLDPGEILLEIHGGSSLPPDAYKVIGQVVDQLRGLAIQLGWEPDS